MANYISLNPKNMKMAGVGSNDEQMIHAYRAVTCWLVAALIKEGRLHIPRQSLDAAIKHLEACDEMPSFRIEKYDDGCESLELVRHVPLS